MIKREHIKQAVDAIASRDPDIGYTLDEMLGMGLIDAPSQTGDLTEGPTFYFLFEGEKVPVNKVLFFNEGTVPIEQGLLIKYGELVKKQEIQDKGGAVDYKDVYREIHAAGLRSVVVHEIDFAISRLCKEAGNGSLISLLEGIKDEKESLDLDSGDIDPYVMCRGVVDDGSPACLVCFPLSMAGLMQVGDMNVEFFSVRFVLWCLIKGHQRNLMACVVDRRIVGLIFLSIKERAFSRDLEIKFLATLRGRTGELFGQASRPPRGVGTFLVAGAWLRWKNEMSGLRNIILDAEVGARPFYDSVGFQARGLSEYVLKEPKGSLLKTIIGMVHRCPNLEAEVIRDVGELLRRKVKKLRKRARDEKGVKERKAVIASLEECLRPGARTELREAILETLTGYRDKIPESKELLEMVMRDGQDKDARHAARADR